MMIVATESIERLIRFVSHSPDALLQLLVGAAGKRTYSRIINCPTYPAAARSSDLPEALELFAAILKRPRTLPSTFLARLYSAAHPLEQRKKFGRFFTPPAVAEWALSITPPRQEDAYFDAGSGTAVFAQALVKGRKGVRSYVGIEVDPILALCGAHVLEAVDAPGSFRIWYANFFNVTQKSCLEQDLPLPTTVISNPPFVRFHNVKGRARILATIEANLGIKPSALSGAGNYFLCKAAELIKGASGNTLEATPGRLLFFFPKEAVGAAHSRLLREDLRTKQGWDCSEHVIPEELLNETGLQPNALAVMFRFDHKARRILEPAMKPEPRATVGDILSISRGIATGCNQFFVLSDEEASKREIPKRYLRPVLPTRISLKNLEFSQEDWEGLLKSGHPCWLLVLPNQGIHKFESAIQHYLKEGVRRGLNATATAVRLKTWYSLPVPAEPSDVFVTYLFRGTPRFISNRARVHYLTNILGGRLKYPLAKGVNKATLVESLNRTANGWVGREAAWREYRDSLCKIEPRELARLPIDSALEGLFQDYSPSYRIVRSLFD